MQNRVKANTIFSHKNFIIGWLSLMHTISQWPFFLVEPHWHETPFQDQSSFEIIDPVSRFTEDQHTQTIFNPGWLSWLDADGHGFRQDALLASLPVISTHHQSRHVEEGRKADGGRETTCFRIEAPSGLGLRNLRRLDFSVSRISWKKVRGKAKRAVEVNRREVWKDCR